MANATYDKDKRKMEYRNGNTYESLLINYELIINTHGGIMTF